MNATIDIASAIRPPPAQELLRVWERGFVELPANWAITMLSAAGPSVAPEALARMRIGLRDGLLLSVREALLGPRLSATASCPACATALEFECEVNDLRATTAADNDGLPAVTIGEYLLRARLPDSRDLLAVGAARDVERGRRLLLERCLITAERDGEPVAAEALPGAIAEQLIDHLARADPQADVELALTCPECGHNWLAPFDIVAFLWTEIDAWARGLLDDVHHLASAYGWSEGEVLSLSPWRRQYYLELVAQ